MDEPTYDRPETAGGEAAVEDAAKVYQRELGARIRRARQAVGFQQVDLARSVGMSRSSVANLEAGRQGNLSAFALLEYARVLGCSPVWLLVGESPVASAPMPSRRAGLVALAEGLAALTASVDAMLGDERGGA